MSEMKDWLNSLSKIDLDSGPGWWKMVLTAVILVAGLFLIGWLFLSAILWLAWNIAVVPLFNMPHMNAIQSMGIILIGLIIRSFIK